MNIMNITKEILNQINETHQESNNVLSHLEKTFKEDQKKAGFVSNPKRENDILNNIKNLNFQNDDNSFLTPQNPQNIINKENLSQQKDLEKPNLNQVENKQEQENKIKLT